MNMHQKSRQIALGGVLTALAVVILLLGGLIPLATFCCPMLAILVLLPVQSECGPRMSGTAWAAVSLIALLMVPDRELALFYVFFGWYPLLKPHVDKCTSRLLRILCKLLFCSLSIVAIYALLIFIFQLDAILAEFQATSIILTIATLILANITFLMLDTLIARVELLWQYKFRKRFFHG